MTQADIVNPDPVPKFWLGKFNMTDEARYALDMEDILIALADPHATPGRRKQALVALLEEYFDSPDRVEKLVAELLA